MTIFYYSQTLPQISLLRPTEKDKCIAKLEVQDDMEWKDRVPPGRYNRHLAIESKNTIGDCHSFHRGDESEY